MVIIADDELALCTDLYQLTMAQTYFEHGLHGEAVFELFARKLPRARNFLVAAGLQSALDLVEKLDFTPRALRALERTGLFRPEFLDHLSAWRFDGDVWALPEGTVAFADEPLVQVVAPITSAQLVETLVLNQVHFQTVIASKTARIVLAARGREVVDFGLRRAHGLEAGLFAARAAFIAGAEATSDVLAADLWGMPPRGTMAHSAVEAIGADLDAFRMFAQTDPRTVLLVDTFDTLAGVDAVVALARELGAAFQVRGIRIDSGDLDALSREARRRLDAAGLQRVRIIASGGLDEHAIDRLTSAGAPIDSFGVGTDLVVSRDAPALDAAYKLVAYEGRGRRKLSPGKATLPGRKQVFRARGADTLGLFGEKIEGALLEPFAAKGRILAAARAPLAEIQARCKAGIAALPERLRALAPAEPYPVRLSDAYRAVLAASP